MRVYTASRQVGAGRQGRQAGGVGGDRVSRQAGWGDPAVGPGGRPLPSCPPCWSSALSASAHLGQSLSQLQAWQGEELREAALGAEMRLRSGGGVRGWTPVPAPGLQLRVPVPSDSSPAVSCMVGLRRVREGQQQVCRCSSAGGRAPGQAWGRGSR